MTNPAAVCVLRAQGDTDTERATNHLRARYAAVTELNPAYREDVSEALYIRVNLPYCVRNLRNGCAHVWT